MFQIRLSVAIFAGILFAAPVSAFRGVPLESPYQPLSSNHLDYGVSQLLAGDIGGTTVPVRLHNPGPVTMRAVVLIYERAHLDDIGLDVEPAQLVAGLSVKLTPHASIGIREEALEAALGTTYPPPRLYFEVLSVPEKKVSVQNQATRVADGLGLAAGGPKEQRGLHPIHPTLFSLPEDAFQRNKAVNTMCQPAIETNQRSMWIEFGVTCYHNSLPEGP